MPDPPVFASVLEALGSPDLDGTLLIDEAFLARYRPNIDWLIDRLGKSTAGVRGLIVAGEEPPSADRRRAEASPQLNFAVVALVAQAYADYFGELAPERRAAFIGFDGRFFSQDYADLFARIFAGNGLRA